MLPAVHDFNGSYEAQAILRHDGTVGAAAHCGLQRERIAFVATGSFSGRVIRHANGKAAPRTTAAASTFATSFEFFFKHVFDVAQFFVVGQIVVAAHEVTR